MLAGISQEERHKLELRDAEHYIYLTQGECITCEGRDDKKEFADIRRAMKVTGFIDQEVWEVLRVLAALLHLGNIQYTTLEQKNIDNVSVIQEMSHVRKATSLLKVQPQHVVDALTSRTIVARNETITTALPIEDARNVRDAFTKGIYGRLFIWIVDKINRTIHKPKRHFEKYRKSIGVLDIFGFENLDLNSFEQLCINYANETLQQFFVHHTFEREQNEYEHEGIEWKHINFVDNKDILDLIGAKAMSIMSLVDEECIYPKGTDQTLLEKLNKKHSCDKKYILLEDAISTQFGLKHFAGAVVYEVKGFLEKNRDTFSRDLLRVVQASSNKLLGKLFAGEISEIRTHLTDEENKQGIHTKKRNSTLGAQFRESLSALFQLIEARQPQFVRCIKPNEHKISSVTQRSDASKDQKTTSSARPVEEWTNEELSAWRKETNLLGEKLNNVTQQQFAYYTNMSKRAPAFFYRSLEKDLEITDRELKASFTAAVDNVLTRDILYQQEDEAVRALQKTKWTYDSINWISAITANVMTTVYLKHKIASLWKRK